MGSTSIRTTLLFFPELIRGDVAAQFCRDAIKGRKGIDSHSQQSAAFEKARVELIPEGFESFGKHQIETSLTQFAKADAGVLALANRYDGLDLADDSCRMTVLSGLPMGSHLQEHFSSAPSEQRASLTKGCGHVLFRVLVAVHEVLRIIPL